MVDTLTATSPDDVPEHVEPLDVVCGKAAPLRSSKLAVLYAYEYNDRCTRTSVEDKRFEMDVVVLTTKGEWTFHGARGKQAIDSASVTVGVAGDGYGCGHERTRRDGNLIACLRPGALEPDDRRLFGRQVLPAHGVSLVLHKASRTVDDGAFDSLMFGLFDTLSAGSHLVTEPGPGKVRIQRVKRFIEERAFGPVTLADIAASVGLSPYVCVRQFRQATGVTPYAYVLELRLQRATKLLGRGAMSVESVAAQVGFRDPAYFSRLFKRKTGTAPSRLLTA